MDGTVSCKDCLLALARLGNSAVRRRARCTWPPPRGRCRGHPRRRHRHGKRHFDQALSGLGLPTRRMGYRFSRYVERFPDIRVHTTQVNRFHFELLVWPTKVTAGPTNPTTHRSRHFRTRIFIHHTHRSARTHTHSRFRAPSGFCSIYAIRDLHTLGHSTRGMRGLSGVGV